MRMVRACRAAAAEVAVESTWHPSAAVNSAVAKPGGSCLGWGEDGAVETGIARGWAAVGSPAGGVKQLLRDSPDALQGSYSSKFAKVVSEK